jgi:hypothetical protein
MGGKMSPSEYKALRESVGSQRLVADALDNNRTTIQRREAGECEITLEAELALRKFAGLRAERTALGAGRLEGHSSPAKLRAVRKNLKKANAAKKFLQ